MSLLSKTKPLFKRINFTSLTIVVSILLALLSLWYFNSQKIYYVGSDIYYYFSLSDSLNKFGYLSDLTRVPAWSLKTPQNGIVFLVNLLENTGMSKASIITQLPSLLFILYSFSFIPIYKITKLFKFNKSQTNLVALFYFSNWWIYRLQLLPSNDGFFNVLSFWFIYLVLENWLNRKKTLIPIFAIALISPHFRIHTFLILISLVIATYLSKKRKNLMKSLLIFATSYASLKLFFLTKYVNPFDKDIGNAGAQITGMFNRFFGESNRNFILPLLASFSKQIHLAIPSLFLTPLDRISPTLNWLYLPILFFPLYYFAKGIKDKKFTYLFLSLFISISFLFSLVTPYFSERHYAYTYIFVIILMVKFLYSKSFLKPFLYIYLFTLMSYSLFAFSKGYPRACRPLLLYQLQEEGVVLEDNAILVSQEPRHSYYFLGKSHTSLDNNQINSQNKNIYIFGSANYIGKNLTKINSKSSIKFNTRTIQNLTSNQETCSLVKLNSYL
ncbi:hypothetical protein HN928_05595 [bacterium]|jgi:hypothetical protein|nr:hypothetical protein [bacterium]